MTQLLRRLQDPFTSTRRIRRVLGLLRFKLRQVFLRRVSKANLSISSTPPFFGYQAFLTDSPKGNALLAYLAFPFHAGREKAVAQDYSNSVMALELADALNRLGYVVDIVDYTDLTFKPSKEYAIFVGMTTNFTRLLPFFPDSTVKIYWATRPDPAFEMESTRQRQAAYFLRHQRWPSQPPEISRFYESADYWRADGLFVLGSEFIKNTFRNAPGKVHRINNPVLSHLVVQQPRKRDFSTARNHFLFMCSWQLLRKGLDLVIEAFAKCPELHLHICGPVESEPDFMLMYRKELFHTPNIHVYGWLSMQSPAFEELSSLCGFLVFPSCAEGMAGSVINTMATGLIPIATRESGVDLAGFGVEIEVPTPDGVVAVARHAAQLSVQDLAQRSSAAIQTVLNLHTVDHFRQTVTRALLDCVEKSA
jgi:glycosyltransferase involved in cell wall biosynthesis